MSKSEIHNDQLPEISHLEETPGYFNNITDEQKVKILLLLHKKTRGHGKPLIYQKDKGLYIRYSVSGTRVRKSLKMKATLDNLIKAFKKAEVRSDQINHMLEDIKSKGFKFQIDDTDQLEKHLDSIEPAEALKLSGLFDRYNTDKDIRDKNGNQYKTAITHLINTIGDVHVSTVNTTHYKKLKKYFEDKDSSYSTIRTYLNYLHILYNYLIKKKIYLEENPFTVPKKRAKAYITTVTDEHWKIIKPRLIKENIQLYEFIEFLRLSGFRKNEVTTLLWKDVKLDENIITVTTHKDNDREDIFPLNLDNGELKKLLEEMYKKYKPNPDDKVFTLHSEWIRTPFQNLIDDINKDDKIKVTIPKYTLHDLRRTAISRWVKSYQSIQVMKLARHKDISTTLGFYAHVDMLDIAKTKKQ